MCSKTTVISLVESLFYGTYSLTEIRTYRDICHFAVISIAFQNFVLNFFVSDLFCRVCDQKVFVSLKLWKFGFNFGNTGIRKLNLLYLIRQQTFSAPVALMYLKCFIMRVKNLAFVILQRNEYLLRKTKREIP